eukprot:CAMPEP_0205826918 /NCGR_PEP_ID=MMETSP0206-20130828/30238_1 /ASSEMBLY_ACC=CAM_ASM_000279 /TAXON_ID=36767 /ORGANISM="Euplotes focardii, Strain TN1" /LENGTH=86 /DNA_ID=CAMNT_0053127269 /DNA_START=1400 /DNA_END=1657 /DNA_ORIENTATION=+
MNHSERNNSFKVTKEPDNFKGELKVENISHVKENIPQQNEGCKEDIQEKKEDLNLKEKDDDHLANERIIEKFFRVYWNDWIAKTKW